MTPPSPTTPLPSGYELLSPDFLREHGAVEGMKCRFIDREFNDEWEEWSQILQNRKEIYLENKGGKPNESDLQCLEFIAPTGTTAMLSTPLPEVRCECCDKESELAYRGGHDRSCPAHPRNALVRVPLQLLAGLPKKPEGLLWADMLAKRWSPMNLDWKFFKESVSLDPVFAYAIKQHEMDAIEAGKEKAPLPATGYANEEEIRRLAQIPQGVSLWDGVRNLAEQNERLKGRIRELNNDDGNAAPVTAAPEKSDPSQVSGPTDGGKWQPIETAPKDGTEILLFSHGDQGVCYWSTCMSHGPGWTWGAGNYFRHPTHWMPLPPPPTAAMKDQTK